MKSVFIAGSRKFYDEMGELISRLKRKGIEVENVGKIKEENRFEKEKKAILSAFKMIDRSDILYVYSKNGYVGKAVSMEIAYAYSKDKEIISSEEIEEYSARALIDKVVATEEFIEYLD